MWVAIGVLGVIYVVLAILLASLQSWVNAQYVAPGQTRIPLDVEEYKGTWFEIARYPNDFQSNCSQSIADYSLNSAGGYIVVKNTCIGKHGTRVVLGKAFSTANPGQLAVSFFPGFYGQYGVIYREDTISIVGTSDRQYLWILARTVSIDDTTLARLLAMVELLGYDTARLVYDTVTTV